jgi:hypothetical protein
MPDMHFIFFFDKKTKQKNQGLQVFNNLNFIKTKCSRVIFEQALNPATPAGEFSVLLSFYFI